MYKFVLLGCIVIILSIALCTYAQEVSVSVERQTQQTTNTASDQSQDFYKATVQAYKDFNEQVIKYVSTAIAVVSTFITGLVILFIFLFRRTLAEIKKDIKDDADRINDVYAKTFELLNKQAETNLRIFDSRESELKDTIEKARELNDKMKDIFTKISEKESIRDKLVEELVNKEFEGVQKESSEMEKEVNSMKVDLDKFQGEK